MISLSEARVLIGVHIPSLPAHAAPLAAAAGAVLREDVFANADMPPFDRSAMDGYAVGVDDYSRQFRVVGEIQPGQIPTLQLKTGEAARIFTGAAIPAGATQVIMQENVRVDGSVITPTTRDQTTHIRRRGEDVQKGGRLLESGTRLGASELALLASFGVMSPRVSPRVRVAHFTTGNEIVAPSQTPAPGQIRDSNSSLVAAFIHQHGGEIVHQQRLPDDFDSLVAAVGSILPNMDLLLVSGGASVGDYDFGRKLLSALGFQTHFTALKLRPGKPLVFATRGRQAAFILPGNPVSHFVTLHVAVCLALDRFSGASHTWPMVGLKLAERIHHRPDDRETYWPAHVEIVNRELVVHPLRWQSSGDVTGLTGANALIQLAGPAVPRPGEIVPVLMLASP
jgi:molybdopterin molybdotransferase